MNTPQELVVMPRFAVVDVETSGLYPDSDIILQIAVVHQDWSVIEQYPLNRSGADEKPSIWCTYVRPRHPLTVNLGPHHIHGISRRNLLLAPPMKNAMRTFAKLTAGRIVVAHNADFDTQFLETAAVDCGVDLQWAGVMCTLDLSRRLDPERSRNHKLATLCTLYDIDLAHAHDALHDARATATLLSHLLCAHNVKKPIDLQPLLRP